MKSPFVDVARIHLEADADGTVIVHDLHPSEWDRVSTLWLNYRGDRILVQDIDGGVIGLDLSLVRTLSLIPASAQEDYWHRQKGIAKVAQESRDWE